MQRSVESRQSPSLSDALLGLFGSFSGRDIRIGEILEHMGARGFGFTYILFGMLAAALPAVLCSLMSMPVLLFSAQQMAGLKRPLMPAKFDGRTYPADTIRNALLKAAPWLDRLERFSRPRWPVLAGDAANRIAAMVCFLMALIILIPGPFTNTPPGMAIALIGLAMTSRDGLLMLLSLLASVAAVFISLSALGAFAVVLYGWIKNHTG